MTRDLSIYCFLAHLLDCWLTLRAIDRGIGFELNPILSPLSDQPFFFCVVKMGIAVSSILILNFLRHIDLAKKAIVFHSVLITLILIWHLAGRLYVHS